LSAESFVPHFVIYSTISRRNTTKLLREITQKLKKKSCVDNATIFRENLKGPSRLLSACWALRNALGFALRERPNPVVWVIMRVVVCVAARHFKQTLHLEKRQFLNFE